MHFCQGCRDIIDISPNWCESCRALFCEKCTLTLLVKCSECSTKICKSCATANDGVETLCRKCLRKKIDLQPEEKIPIVKQIKMFLKRDLFREVILE